MKSCMNNSQKSQGCRQLAVAAGMAIACIVQPALAVDRTWFGGSGDSICSIILAKCI